MFWLKTILWHILVLNTAQLHENIFKLLNLIQTKKRTKQTKILSEILLKQHDACN